MLLEQRELLLHRVAEPWRKQQVVVSDHEVLYVGMALAQAPDAAVEALEVPNVLVVEKQIDAGSRGSERTASTVWWLLL